MECRTFQIMRLNYNFVRLEIRLLVIMIYHVGFLNNVLMNYPVLSSLLLINPFRQVPYLWIG